MPPSIGNKTRPTYDVIVVGSGAAGGMSAYVLAQAGLKVLMLEAGRDYRPADETPMLNLPRDAPLRGAPTPYKPMGFYDATVDGGWDPQGEPYTDAPGTPPELRFRWWRARMLGGRTNHWGRMSLRFGPYDFKPRTRDGLGVDWPLTYDELAPYYDKVERLIGVYGGGPHGLENTPDSPPGILLPPPAPRPYEALVKHVAPRLGIGVVPAHVAVLSRPLDHERLPKQIHPDNPRAAALLAEHMQQRLGCIWATPCDRGCAIGANFQSTTVLLPPAVATGNLDIITNAMVREVIIDAHGRATGVHYIDKVTRRDRRASARAVVLAAGACDSTRILLNSRGRARPAGLGNGHGQLGRGLTDTVGFSVMGQIPALESLPPHNDDGSSLWHVYMPWWLYKEQQAGKLGFARGYHIEMSGGRALPGASTFQFLGRVSEGAYGHRLKQEARRYYGSFLTLSGRGEMIPSDDAACELDPEKVDQWGIPVLRFRWKWSAHELQQVEHMRKTFKDLIGAMGGRALGDRRTGAEPTIMPPGNVVHEVGSARMGDSERTSVLNRWNQCWEAKNVFVTDGAAFASNANKNPTLTILALAWRACEHLMAEMKRRSI